MREIEIDEAPPLGDLGALNRKVDIAAADIVDKDIDWRDLRERALAEVLAVGGVGDVSGKGPRLAPS